MPDSRSSSELSFPSHSDFRVAHGEELQLPSISFGEGKVKWKAPKLYDNFYEKMRSHLINNRDGGWMSTQMTPDNPIFEKISISYNPVSVQTESPQSAIGEVTWKINHHEQIDQEADQDAE